MSEKEKRTLGIACVLIVLAALLLMTVAAPKRTRIRLGLTAGTAEART